jgi:hypothetical protein
VRQSVSFWCQRVQRKKQPICFIKVRKKPIY